MSGLEGIDVNTTKLTISYSATTKSVPDEKDTVKSSQEQKIVTNKILVYLIQKKLLTKTDELKLQANESKSKDFLKTLIQIYEQKAELYLLSCQRSVKVKLKEKSLLNGYD